MFMTEQGAGSDVAATATRAVPDADGGLSAVRRQVVLLQPRCRLAMVLARIDGAPAGMAGVSLFLLPRTLDRRHAQRYRILRLKDKLGTRSMASGEIRLEGARAWLVGEPAAASSRWPTWSTTRACPTACARRPDAPRLTEALFVARERRAFGRRLIDLPLMRRQLLKLLLPTEQARTMVFQTAEALRRADAGEERRLRAGAHPHAADQVPRLPRRAQA
jgi:acyl-CoA dehydrogenase